MGNGGTSLFESNDAPDACDLLFHFTTFGNGDLLLRLARLRAHAFNLSDNVHSLNDFTEDDLNESRWRVVCERALQILRTCLPSNHGVVTVVMKNCEPSHDECVVSIGNNVTELTIGILASVGHRK